jgi:hypothetical protein
MSPPRFREQIEAILQFLLLYYGSSDFNSNVITVQDAHLQTIEMPVLRMFAS